MTASPTRTIQGASPVLRRPLATAITAPAMPTTAEMLRIQATAGTVVSPLPKCAGHTAAGVPRVALPRPYVGWMSISAPAVTMTAAPVHAARRVPRCRQRCRATSATRPGSSITSRQKPPSATATEPSTSRRESINVMPIASRVRPTTIGATFGKVRSDVWLGSTIHTRIVTSATVSEVNLRRQTTSAVAAAALSAASASTQATAWSRSTV